MEGKDVEFRNTQKTRVIVMKNIEIVSKCEELEPRENATDDVLLFEQNDITDVPLIDISDLQILNIPESNNQLPDIVPIYYTRDNDTSVRETTNVSTPTTSTTSKSSESETRSILRLCSGIYSYVKSIDQRLENFENKATDENPDNIEYVQKMIPVRTEDEIKLLETVLENTDKKDAFIAILRNIGGRHPKDCVHRMLKTVYTNSFGVQCSWLGQRNNIRICDTKVMSIIKEVTLSNYPLKLHEFEIYASEWFRLSKLRCTREQRIPN